MWALLGGAGTCARQETVYMIYMKTTGQRTCTLAREKYIFCSPFSRDPSIHIIPTLGPKVCKYYLHRAIWIPAVCLESFASCMANPAVSNSRSLRVQGVGIGVWGLGGIL